MRLRSMPHLEPRVALVTGASSGIGRAIARELAGQGVQVIATARRQELLQELVHEFPALVTSVQADLTDPAAPEALAKVLESQVGQGYPVLVNAGGIGIFGSYDQMDPRQISDLMAVNFMGPALLIHACMPLILKQKGGLVVNILSVTCKTVIPGCAAYAASKDALFALGKTVLAEYRGRGLRLTSVMPGAVDTPIWAGGAGGPNRADMLSAETIAKVVFDIVLSPADRNIDEIVCLPPKGVL